MHHLRTSKHACVPYLDPAISASRHHLLLLMNKRMQTTSLFQKQGLFTLFPDIIWNFWMELE